MAENYFGSSYPYHDFSQALAGIGANFGNAYQRNRMGNALTGVNGDMNAAAQRLLEMGRIDDAAKLGTLGIGQDRNSIAAALAQAKMVPQGVQDPATANMSPEESTAFLRERGKLKGREVANAPMRLAARKFLSEDLNNLKNYYLELQKEGGIVDPSQDWMTNVRARAGASDIGQSFEGTIGTKAQSLRDKIGTVRPGLVNSIRAATGMSARSMDSNVELQFQLKQATDPTLGLPANLAAIDRLERVYGLSGQNMQPIDTGGAEDTDAEPAIGEERDSPQGPARYIGNDQWELVE